MGGEIERKLGCGSILERYIYHFIIVPSFLNLKVYREELSIRRAALKIWWRSSLSMRRLYKHSQQHFIIGPYHMDLKTMLPSAKALNSRGSLLHVASTKNHSSDQKHQHQKSGVFCLTSGSPPKWHLSS